MARNINNSIIKFVLMLCMLICLSGCGKKEKEEQLEVTISIDCNVILDNYDDLNKEKTEFVPEDGWILKDTKVKVSKGASVFDVLKKVCKDNKIQIESSTSPVYKSVYVEGINQLYEFDCGPSSGWLYKVNGEFPNYGCSAYMVEDGDNIDWEYTVTIGDLDFE